MSRRALAICLAIAFVAGAATATLARGTVAGSYWQSGATLMGLSRPLRSAYAAGAHDMFAAIIELIATSSDGSAAATILAADSCLDQRTAGTLGQFTDWAETIWRGRQESAAKLLLMEACK